MRRSSAWLAEEDEIERDQLVGLKPPQLDHEVVEPLTDDQLRALIAACTGTDPLSDRRDAALIRFMFGTGCRAGEVAVMKLSDIHLVGGIAIVRRGKGGKAHSVPFGVQTTRAMDRYTRTRRTHRLGGTDALWLGNRGESFSYDALHKTLAMHAEVAGIVEFYPHRLAPHRGPPLAGSRRLRGMPDGGRRLDPPGHAAPLHQGPGRTAGRHRGSRSQRCRPVMPGRTRQAAVQRSPQRISIIYGRNEGVISPEVGEAGVPLGPVGSTLAGGRLGEDALAAVGTEFVELLVDGLVGASIHGRSR